MRLNCPLRPVRGLPENNRIRQRGRGSPTKRTNRSTARGCGRAKCSPASSARKCGAFSTASPRVCQRPPSRSSARCACEPGHSVRPAPRSFEPLPACRSVRRTAFRAGPRGRPSSPRVQPVGTRTAPEVEPSGLASIAAVGRGSEHWDRITVRRRLMQPLAFPPFLPLPSCRSASERRRPSSLFGKFQARALCSGSDFFCDGIARIDRRSRTPPETLAFCAGL